MSQTEYVANVRGVYEILVDVRLADISVNYLIEETVQMSHKFKVYHVEKNANTNISIALFTTANARQRLYEISDELGTAVVIGVQILWFIQMTKKNTVQTGRWWAWVDSWVPKRWVHEAMSDDWSCELMP